ncbi:hypothetical protein ACGFNU_42720 [Spirillospora sp. NPDC048911]|uniref:hypothetical protein n=1 Tax=Spirillospora sp. NPDC048911 TaxID=3364527 RepID=UPI00371AD546
MRRTGPLLALLAGLAVLIIIATTVLVRTVSSDTEPDASPPPPLTATTAAPAPPPIPQSANATFASRVPGSRAVVALTVKGGNAIAYVCDGRSLEAWLRGKVYPEGLIRLQGKKGILTGSVQGDTVIGAASLSRKGVMGFRAPVVRPPSGLYRAAARTTEGAQLVGGWIILPSGAQVGLVNYGKEPRPAPVLNPGAGAITIEDERVAVAPADPDAP